MGFWGKAIGAGLGLLAGGPIGAIIGGVIGHTFDADGDRQRASAGYHEIDLEREFDRQYLFYVSLASLAAKMAKADGRVTQDEIRAFDHFLRHNLGLTMEERKMVAQIFNEAKNSPESAEDIARQFKALLGFQRDVMRMMLELLFHIALADDQLHSEEERFLEQMAAILGLGPQEYQQVKALFVKADDRDYKILGVSSNASDDEIKKAYRRLVQEYHPDKLQAKGVPEDFMKVAHDKMAEINAAYNAIRKQRGI